MLTLGFCDDDTSFLIEFVNTVQLALNAMNESFQTECFTDGTMLLKQIQLGIQFDGLFLDIEMPEIGGLQLIQKIHEVNLYLPVIFLTNHEELVFDALHLQPLSFIRKNNYSKDITAVLHSIIRNQQRTEKAYLFRYNGQEIRCHAADILYVYSARHEITVVCKEQREFLVTDTIQNLCKMLDDSNFFRINSGCIVNMEYIMTIEPDSVILDNYQQLSVSRRLMPSLRERFKEFYRNK